MKLALYATKTGFFFIRLSFSTKYSVRIPAPAIHNGLCDVYVFYLNFTNYTPDC